MILKTKILQIKIAVKSLSFNHDNTQNNIFYYSSKITF